VTPTGIKTAPAPPKPNPKIDPRIRARRIEVKRTEGRRRLHRLGALGIAVAAVAGLWALTLTPLLDVDTFKVTGARHTGDAAVIAAVRITRHDALLTADVGAAASALARLPWIATARVRRSWPGTIAITVVERTPVAAIASKDGRWVVVDRGGRQLAVEKEPAVDLVRIAGRPLAGAPGAPAGARYRGAIDLATVLPPSTRGAIASLWPQPDGSLDGIARLPGNASAAVHFGAADQLEAKIVALASVLERADLTHVHIIDLRVPDAPALTRA
jgi:cell division protein FtsQ